MAKDNELRLTRLEELKGYQVAEGDHDIRGWEVRTPDGNKIGTVEELIVDPAERRVRDPRRPGGRADVRLRAAHLAW